MNAMKAGQILKIIADMRLLKKQSSESYRLICSQERAKGKYPFPETHPEYIKIQKQIK